MASFYFALIGLVTTENHPLLPPLLCFFWGIRKHPLTAKTIQKTNLYISIIYVCEYRKSEGEI